MRCFASVLVAAGLLLAGMTPRGLAQERARETDALKARVAELENKLSSAEQKLSQLLAVQKGTLSVLKQSQHAASAQLVGHSGETPAAASSGSAGLPPATGNTQISWKGPGQATIPIGGGSARLVDGSELQIATHGVASANMAVGGVGHVVAGRTPPRPKQSAPAAAPKTAPPAAEWSEPDDTELALLRYVQRVQYAQYVRYIQWVDYVQRVQYAEQFRAMQMARLRANWLIGY